MKKQSYPAFVAQNKDLVRCFTKAFNSIIKNGNYYVFARPSWLTDEIQSHIVNEHDNGHQLNTEKCDFCIANGITTEMMWIDNTIHTIRACLRIHLIKTEQKVPQCLIDPIQEDTVRRGLELYDELFHNRLSDYCLSYLFFAARKAAFTNIRQHIEHAVCIVESLENTC